MSRARILYIEFNEDNTVGGSHQALFDLVTQLDRTQFEPVVAFRQENLFAKKTRQAGIETHIFEAERLREMRGFVSPSRLARWWTKLYALGWRRRFLRRHGIDLVHLNNTPNMGFNTWLPMARALGIPCLVNAMGDVVRDPSPFNQRLMQRYDRVVAISEHMREEVLRAGIPDERIEVIYLGVDIDGFRARVSRSSEEVRGEWELSDDRLLAVMVGNIREWKGQHVVLEALHHLDPDTRGRLLVLFVGDVSKNDEEYAASLHRQVGEYGLEECVRFVGVRRDVPDLFHAADIALHASITPEPFGLVVPEAMSVGAAVIATSIGGPGEILTPQSGLTYDPQHPTQLTRHLHTLIHNPELRQKLGEEARRRVEDFSQAHCVEQMEDLYRRMLGRG